MFCNKYLTWDVTLFPPTITYIISINKYNVVWDQTTHFSELLEIGQKEQVSRNGQNHGGVG